MEMLAPIDEALDTVTKQYVDDKLGGANEVTVGGPQPTDGTDLWLDTTAGDSLGGGLIFTDEAQRDATLIAPTSGVTCYLINRKAHCVYQSGWKPMPGAGAICSSACGAIPGNATPVYPTVTLAEQWGYPIGYQGTGGDAGRFMLNYTGKYQVSCWGTFTVPGDSIYSNVSGLVRASAGSFIYPTVLYYPYQNPWYCSRIHGGSDIAVSGTYSNPGHGAPTRWDGMLAIQYVGA